MGQDIRYSAIIHTAKLAIHNAGLAAVAAKDTPAFEPKMQDLENAVKKHFADLLFAEAGLRPYSSAPSQARKRESISQQYVAILTACHRRLPRIVQDFDPEKAGGEYGFFTFLYSCLYFDIKGEFAEQKQEIHHSGITAIYDSEAEEQLLRRMLRFMEREEIPEYDMQNIRAFLEKEAEKQPHKDRAALLAQIIKVWRANQRTYATDLNEALSVQGEMSSDDRELIRILIVLNHLYRSFNDNQKRVFPTKFTGDYIKEVAKAAMTARRTYLEGQVHKTENLQNEMSLTQFVREYIDWMTLPEKREYYANGDYLCMIPEPFDYTIENKQLRTDKDVGQLFGITAATVGNISKQVYQKVREKMEMQ